MTMLNSQPEKNLGEAQPTQPMTSQSHNREGEQGVGAEQDNFHENSIPSVQQLKRQMTKSKGMSRREAERELAKRKKQARQELMKDYVSDQVKVTDENVLNDFKSGMRRE